MEDIKNEICVNIIVWDPITLASLCFQCPQEISFTDKKPNCKHCKKGRRECIYPSQDDPPMHQMGKDWSKPAFVPCSHEDRFKSPKDLSQDLDPNDSQLEFHSGSKDLQEFRLRQTEPQYRRIHLHAIPGNRLVLEQCQIFRKNFRMLVQPHGRNFN